MKPLIIVVLVSACGVSYGAGFGLLFMSIFIGSQKGALLGALAFLVAWPCFALGYVLDKITKEQQEEGA